MATFYGANQTVASQQNIVFTTPICYPQNCRNSVIFTSGSGLVSLRGGNCQCKPAIYRISFGANLAVPTGGTVGAIALALSVNGEGLTRTESVVTPAAVNEFFNVSREIEVTVPCGCCYQVGVKNVTPTGGTAQAIDVTSPTLTITRVA